MASNAELLFQRIIGNLPTAQGEIERLISEKVPESEFLDYKGADQLNDVTIKDLWSKALSAFANSGGGVLIWGVDCRDTIQSENNVKLDLPTGTALHPSVQQLAQKLSAYHANATADVVESVVVRAVPFDGGPAGCVVCFIPEGRNKPYRALFSGEHYYVRNPDRMQRVSHSLLRSLFYAKASGRLAYTMVGSPPQQAVGGQMELMFSIDVRNVGTGTATDLFVQLEINAPMEIHQVREDFWEQIKTEDPNKLYIFNFSGRRPIHPGFNRKLCNFKLTFPVGTMSHPAIKFMFDTFVRDSDPARAVVTFHYGPLSGSHQRMESVPEPFL